ncbi:MAG: AAA family ATPase, partial [Silvibacterium sp.]|nr:AAA family ATPase [Silvibacterium sp.]
MRIQLPELSLILLIGPSGCGKSSFARKHFLPTEVISSDFCRGLVADDENDQSATGDAFDLVHAIASKRLARGRLTVIDATNVQPESRKPLVELAREYHVLPVAIIFDLPEKLCHERNASRPDRQFGPHVVRNQAQQMRRSLRGLEREGFRHISRLSSPEEVDHASIERQPLWNNKRDEHGPFDIVGDVHGCLDELLELLRQVGYGVDSRDGTAEVHPPEGRKLVFVGDLVDRGPATPEVLKLVMGMVKAGQAFCVPGNHDVKLVKALKGRDVQLTHGLAESMQQLRDQPTEFRAQASKFLDGLVSHYVLDDGKLVVAHAG